ncbi:MAG TPA: hypothetical protein VJV23_06235 [Candidatus Polarisedimenticolia bacterium]|nr:hypothetical protein [Candidatus Polarisedimenticolia bacterium]
MSDLTSNSKRPLAWDPDMDEVPDRPPCMLMIDPFFTTIYQGRRRTIVTGEVPKGLPAGRCRRHQVRQELPPPR